MSKIKALITVLVLGTSSVAMAAPALSFSAHAEWSAKTASAPMIRDHRTQVTPYSYTSNASWRALSSSVFADSRNTIRLSTPMNLSWLKLQATAGTSFIDSMTIRFADGTRKIVRLGQSLNTRAPIQFAVNGGAIASVTVNSSSRGSYQLFGYGRVEQAPPVYQPPVYNPPIHNPPVYEPPVQAGTLLADNLAFEGSGGRRFITVGASAGAFSKVRIASSKGTVFLKELLIEYTDGTSQYIEGIEANLRPGEARDFNLDGGRKTITRIVVYGDANQGELDVIGL